MSHRLFHVYLVGMPGSGKSTVGRVLAARLDIPFVDLDEEIEAAAGASVQQIFQAGGEDRFRDLESEALARVAAGPRSVVSCGGGVVLRTVNRAVLKETGFVVYLAASPDLLAQRLLAVGDRPLIGSVEDVDRLHRDREELYLEVADHIGVAEDDPESSAAFIAEAIG